jgi:hypothetical protein
MASRECSSSSERGWETAEGLRVDTAPASSPIRQAPARSHSECAPVLARGGRGACCRTEAKTARRLRPLRLWELDPLLHNTPGQLSRGGPAKPCRFLAGRTERCWNSGRSAFVSFHGRLGISDSWTWTRWPWNVGPATSQIGHYSPGVTRRRWNAEYAIFALSRGHRNAIVRWNATCSNSFLELPILFAMLSDLWKWGTFGDDVHLYLCQIGAHLIAHQGRRDQSVAQAGPFACHTTRIAVDLPLYFVMPKLIDSTVI